MGQRESQGECLWPVKNSDLLTETASLCWLLLLKMRLSCPKRSITHFLGSCCPCGHAHSFVTSHTPTAFTFSMRRIILFSASQRHSVWITDFMTWFSTPHRPIASKQIWRAKK